MAICAYCKRQETQTYENAVPICLACATDKAVERAATAYGKTDRAGGNRDPFLDEFLTAYLEATDRYTALVDELSRLADGSHHAAFLVCHERVKTLRAEVEETRSAMTKNR